MKYEFGRKSLIESIGLTPKIYSYFIDCSGDKKAKGTQTYVIKRRLKIEDYRKCLQKDKIISRS